MADRRTEQRRAVLLGDGQQRDFAVETDELLDDQFADVAARTFAAVAPCLFQFFGSLHHRLTFARGGHQRFHHAGEADLSAGLLQLLERRGIEITGGFQSQFLGRQVADGLAVHREIHGPGARCHLHPGPFEIVETFGADSLDFGNDDIGTVFGDCRRQCVAVEHVEDLEGVGHLHRGSSRIFVACHDGLAQPLSRNHELLAQFARAQKQYLFHKGM